MLQQSIFINEKVWNTFDQAQTEAYIEAVFQHYRNVGFPYYPTDRDYREKEFQKLARYSLDKIRDGNVIRQTMHGLALAWSYHPHAFNVKCGNKLSPLEAFNDDETLRKVIKKRMKLGTYMADSGMRKMLKMFSGVQGVSNFRPTAAGAIYKHFAPNGKVWDMSMGYGGRLLGAIIANVETYYGNDPCTETFDGLKKMASDFAGGKAILSNLGSEFGHPNIKDGSIDLCFTSPPYFNWEKYSDEQTQSYVKYPTKEEWIDGFLGETFMHCHRYLKPDGHMAINVANTKNFSDLEENVIDVAEKVGFAMVDTWKLALSMPLSQKRKEGGFKYEPIYVFEKR